MPRGRKIGHFVSESTKNKIRLSNLGKRRTQETCERMSNAQKGKKLSEETKRKLSEALKGRLPSSGFTGHKQTDENKDKMRRFQLGRKRSEETRKKISLSKKGHISKLKGRLLSTEHKRKMSEALKGKPRFQFRGENSTNWKGGVTPINQIIRSSLEYRLWRESVFKRDNFTCVWCKQRGGELNADHIKPFSLYPELRFAIDNGRTLCENCHKTTDTFGN